MLIESELISDSGTEIELTDKSGGAQLLSALSSVMQISRFFIKNWNFLFSEWFSYFDFSKQIAISANRFAIECQQVRIESKTVSLSHNHHHHGTVHVRIGFWVLIRGRPKPFDNVLLHTEIEFGLNKKYTLKHLNGLYAWNTWFRQWAKENRDIRVTRPLCPRWGPPTATLDSCVTNWSLIILIFKQNGIKLDIYFVLFLFLCRIQHAYIGSSTCVSIDNRYIVHTGLCGRTIHAVRHRR